MTPETLRAVMPMSGNRADNYALPLTEAMQQYDIATPKQQAMFLAQVCHESGSLRYTLELASGSAYEGRIDLGNVMPGDGVKYKGRGLIQLTGRTNYQLCGAALGVDLVNNQTLLEKPEYAAKSAAWFWKKSGLNLLADQDKFGAVTKIINGGFNGLDDRLMHWLRARKVFGL